MLRVIDRPGTVVAGRFLIVRPLGSGTDNVVHLADDEIAAQRVALKVTWKASMGAVRALTREHAVLRRIDHPGVLKTYDAGILSDGRGYLACEWIDGTSLYHLLKRRRLDLADSLFLVAMVAEALSAVHSAGILHRDVKPLNILLPGSLESPALARATLIDFGACAELSSDGVESGGRTRLGEWTGTGWYMPPEQLLGRRQTRRSDLYALGVMLYELVYGRAPMAEIPLERAKPRPDVPSTYVGEFVVRRCKQDVTFPEAPAIPRRLRDLLSRLLSRAPSDRPASAAELIAELRNLTPEINSAAAATAETAAS